MEAENNFPSARNYPVRLFDRPVCACLVYNTAEPSGVWVWSDLCLRPAVLVSCIGGSRTDTIRNMIIASDAVATATLPWRFWCRADSIPPFSCPSGCPCPFCSGGVQIPAVTSMIPYWPSRTSDAFQWSQCCLTSLVQFSP